MALSHSRSGHGPPPLEVCEQALSVAPITSGITAEESTTTKSYLLPSLLWECTCSAIATPKGSGWCPHLSEDHCHFTGHWKQEQPEPPPWGYSPLSRAQQSGICQRTCPLPQSPRVCTLAHFLSGDETLQTLRKETASIQTKSSPNIKENSKLSQAIRGTFTYQ